MAPLAKPVPLPYAGRHPPLLRSSTASTPRIRAVVRELLASVFSHRGFHIDPLEQAGAPHTLDPVARIAPRFPASCLSLGAYCSGHHGDSWLHSGGGGVTPSAPPTPEGQAILGWGGNSSGQLGDGSNNQRLNPVTVPQRDLRAIAAGGDGSLGLTVDGRVLEWGWGRTSPAEITGLSGVKAIAAGERHRLALTNDGKVWAWGENDRGQLGDGTTTPRSTPVQVVGLSDGPSIAAGARHSLAIGKGFAVMAWGADDAGQLGDGKTTDSPTPVTVPGVTAIALAAGAKHSVALTTDVKVSGGAATRSASSASTRGTAPSTRSTARHIPRRSKWRSPGGSPATWGSTIAATNASTLVVISTGQVVGFGGNGDPAESARDVQHRTGAGRRGPGYAAGPGGRGRTYPRLVHHIRRRRLEPGRNLAGQIGTSATSVVRVS